MRRTNSHQSGKSGFVAAESNGSTARFRLHASCPRPIIGADDIDGTIVEEHICHGAGATTTQGLRRAELLHLIRKAGREPVERDTLYRPVERTEATFTVLV